MPPEVPPTQHPDDPRRTRSDRPGLLTLSPFDNDGQYTRSHSSGPAARVAAMEGLSQPGDPASTIQGLGLMNLEHSLRSEHPMSARESTPAWRGRILSGKEDLAGGQVGAHGRASQVPMEDPRPEAAGSRRPGQMLVELPLPKARASTSFMPPPPPPFTFGAPRGTSLGPSQSLFPAPAETSDLPQKRGSLAAIIQERYVGRAPSKESEQGVQNVAHIPGKSPTNFHKNPLY